VVTWTKNAGGLRSSLYQEAVADEAGRFAVSGFGAGACSASVNAAGFRSEQVQFEIPAAGETPELEVELRPAGQ
jgi:hypothetical protein